MYVQLNKYMAKKQTCVPFLFEIVAKTFVCLCVYVFCVSCDPDKNAIVI